MKEGKLYRWVSAMLSQVPIQSISIQDNIALIQRYRENFNIYSSLFSKKELEAMVQAEEDKKKHAAGNAVAPVDIYEEMEGELEKHEKQKKKLQKYLSFLLNKDAQGLMTINQKRVANAQRARNNYWF